MSQPTCSATGLSYNIVTHHRNGEQNNRSLSHDPTRNDLLLQNEGSPMLAATGEIKRADSRFHTDISWLKSRHSFSFGSHYDPDNVGHGLLLVSNDDIVAPGSGFDTHPHRDMEIITWVLDGELEHKDSEKNRGVLYPGLAQRMSAGRGTWHSEINPSKESPVHFVQMWVLPDTESIDPGYEQLDINTELAKGGLVPIASGRGHDAAISIRQNGAVLWGGRLQPNEKVSIPDDRFVHLYVLKGSAWIEGEAAMLASGDAARFTDLGPRTLEAGPEGAEVLIWAMQP
jgi:quercetin 2,3-dioxygenase